MNVAIPGRIFFSRRILQQRVTSCLQDNVSSSTCMICKSTLGKLAVNVIGQLQAAQGGLGFVDGVSSNSFRNSATLAKQIKT